MQMTDGGYVVHVIADLYRKFPLSLIPILASNIHLSGRNVFHFTLNPLGLCIMLSMFISKHINRRFPLTLDFLVQSRLAVNTKSSMRKLLAAVHVGMKTCFVLCHLF